MRIIKCGYGSQIELNDNEEKPFQQANAERMIEYKTNVNKISDYLYNKFYKIDQFDLYYDEDNQEFLKNYQCANKAEKLFQFFENFDEIKRMLTFLDTVNPGFAKEMIDGL